MKKLIALSAICLISTNIFNALAEEKILAIVNGKEKITESEINSIIEINSGFSGGVDLNSLPVPFKKKLIEQYVIDKSIIKEAKTTKLESDPRYKKALENAKEIILKGLYIKDKFQKQISEKEIKDKYEEFKKQFDGKKEAKLKQMLFKEEAEAKRAFEEINKTGDFAAVAKKLSKEENMDLGYVTEEQLIDNVSQEVFKLSKNQISNVIKSDFGWHIFKLEDMRNIEAPSLEEVKPKLESEIMSGLYRNYIEKIKSQNKIEFKMADDSKNMMQE